MKSKKSIKMILIIAIIGITTLICFNKSFAANTAKVRVDVANIRKTADVNSTILEQVSKNQQVEIIEKTGDWYKIKYNKIEGYLRQDLLEANTEQTQTSTEQTSNESEQSNNQEDTNVVPNTEDNTEETNTQTNIETEKQENNTGIYITKDKVDLKIMPLINSENIKDINKDINVNVLEINNNWALVESGSNRGWVIFSKLKKEETVQTSAYSQEKPQEQEKPANETTKNNEEEKQPEAPTVTQKNVIMYINSEIVNVRGAESTDSECIAKLAKGTGITVISESSNGWSKVTVNGKEGYIASRLLSVTRPEVVTSRGLNEPRNTNNAQESNSVDSSTTSDANNTSNNTSNKVTVPTTQTTTETPQQTSSKGEQVVATAKKYLGCKYVYGGTTPSGFDCSGFTQYVYKQHGVTLNRTAESQASNGTKVSKSNLKLGDLVIFTSHVGIYIGNNQFIHAANPSKGVVITSLSDSYYAKNYITARRIFN